MLDILRQFLNESTTPENLDLMERSCKVLDAVGLYGYVREYEELLVMSSTVTPGETVVWLFKLAKQYVVDAIQQHLVIVNDQITLEQACCVLEGLLWLPDYEIKEDILRAINLDMSTTERFAECLTLTTTIAVESALVFLEDVSEALLLQLKEISLNPPVGNEEDQARDVRNKCVRAVKRALSAFLPEDSKGFVVVQNIMAGMDLGMDYDVYIDAAKTKFDLNDHNKLAGELLLAAYASNDGVDNPQAVAKRRLDELLVDVYAITQVDAAINQRILKVGQYVEA